MSSPRYLSITRLGSGSRGTRHGEQAPNRWFALHCSLRGAPFGVAIRTILIAAQSTSGADAEALAKTPQINKRREQCEFA